MINSGFNQEGVCTDRYYWNGSFPNAVDAFAETCAYPISTLASITPNGTLLAGNYFFFARYTTVDFNPTSFLGESNACQISPNYSSAGINIDGAPGNQVTDKAVTLSISNLDPNYPYIEVAFFYYHDGVFTTGLIDQLYSINPPTATISITITGSETIIDMTSDEIISRKIKNDIPKSITQIENRAWLANLKSRPTYHPDLFAFAQAIKIGWNDSLQVDDRPFAVGQNPLGITAEGQYKDYRKTYNDVGYFRGESYPFAVRFVFTDGRESDPFPMTGFDAWLDPAFATPNDQGIFRMPNNNQTSFRTNVSTATGTGLINILAVQFNTSACIFTTWMQANICAFYFCRGERYENLYYQGVVLRTYTGDDSNQVSCSDSGCSTPCLCINGCSPTTYASANRIPLWEEIGVANQTYAPFLSDCSVGIGPTVYNCTGPFNSSYFPSAGVMPVKKITYNYGLYSPDHHFLRAFTDKTYVVIPQGDALMRIDASGASNYDPGLKISEFGFVPTAPIVSLACCHNIQEWNIANSAGFTSMYDEGSLADPNTFWYSEISCGVPCNPTIKQYNREFATGRYIGMSQDIVACPSSSIGSLDPNNAGGGNVGNYKIANVYRRDPITGFVLTDEYIVKNTDYYKISPLIQIANFAGVTGIPYYQGDCFVQRTYIKQLYNPNYYAITKIDDGGNHYTFGVVHGIVTECKVNTAMRHQASGYKYWPETGLANPSDFIYNDIQFEADFQNRGYNQILSPSPVASGFDVTVPFRGSIFITRIAWTDIYIPGSFADGYRVLQAANFRDYDYRLGQINKIVDLHARLVSVQEYGVNYHFVNDRQAMSTGVADSALLIGTGDVLAQKAQNVTDEVGSQHQWSMVKSDNALYGIDYNKRKIWRLIAEGGVEIISDTKKYRQQVYEIFEQGQPQNQSEFTNIIHKFDDNPVCHEGIVGEYDRKYKEVVWSVIYDQTIQSPKTNNSFAFNEFLNAFTGLRSVPTPFYFKVNNDFFRANPNIFPSQSLAPSTLGDVHVEDMGLTTLGADNRVTFFGTLYPTRLKFVVNNYADNTKIFDHFFINSGPEPLNKITYTTMQQEALQFPFQVGTPQFLYVDPTYKENQWRVIIPRATSVFGSINNIYSVKSPMRGTWLEINLEYLTNKDIFVKSCVNMNRVSSI
ncbi:MAG: hypothetical protein ABIW84_01590 [Ilumatobacteraceae bacterium]